MALLPWRTGKLIQMADHGPDTRSFWFEVTETPVFDFKPGQFVTLDLPIHEKTNKRLRSYSIASWPDGTNVFELLIVMTPGGAGTSYLFTELKKGDSIRFRGAQGVFTLPEPVNQELFMICTGTGIAPFRSMLQAVKHQQITAGNINLLFGCRTRADLLYYDELKNLEEAIPGFRFIPVLSRENWEGKTGYVHAEYEALCKDKPDALFFLCGWKNMVDEARQRIRAMGYSDKMVHLELYG